MKSNYIIIQDGDLYYSEKSSSNWTTEIEDAHLFTCNNDAELTSVSIACFLGDLIDVIPSSAQLVKIEKEIIINVDSDVLPLESTENYNLFKTWYNKFVKKQ